MKRILVAFAASALFAGCASWTPRPPPESAPPPEEGPPDDPQPPAEEKPPEVKPPEPAPKPPRREIPGWWVSRAALGPGSANVRKVEMIFEDGGAFAGTMLVEVEGKKRFASLEGTWRQEEGKLTATFSDGRVRTWGVGWDGGILILKDGEAELRLERAAE